jgi:hypothetical protein
VSPAELLEGKKISGIEHNSKFKKIQKEFFSLYGLFFVVLKG